MNKLAKPPEQVLADNLKRLMEHYPALNSENKVAKAGRISQRTVNRARNAIQIKLDSLQGLARAFGLAPWQMLIPDLDPANPPLLAATKEEKALYQRLQDAAKAIYTP